MIRVVTCFVSLGFDIQRIFRSHGDQGETIGGSVVGNERRSATKTRAQLAKKKTRIVTKTFIPLTKKKAEVMMSCVR